uniref:Monodehydroascorbate reductase n=1 Tax=Tanacetum cinerariifolium TaxID=118510 RepID=A0A699H8F1_TANCI|nr:monodehydroascorbate reductase [Tanacetum cinerariifolium]
MQASLQGKDNVIRQLKKKLSQLQVTRIDTDRSQQRAKQLAYVPLIRKKQVNVAKPSDKLDGVNSCPNASGSQPKSHVKSNRISPAKDVNKLPVEDQPRTNKSHLRTSNRVASSSRLKRTGSAFCVTAFCSIAFCLNKIADLNALLSQTPGMAPPLHADDQILPHIREALHITPVNNNQAFVAPPSIDGLIDFVNQLGYPKLVRNLSNVVTNDLFQPWRALLTIINLCLTGKTSRFKRPRALVLQILWGVITRTNIDYAERIWEEFTQSIHTFIDDKWNLSWHTSGKKRVTLIVIPSIQFTKLIIHHLQRRHRFHSRPDSLLHLPNEEPVLGYLNFSAKGTKREVFRMPIPGSLITTEIQQASYYREYLAKVDQHRRYLAGETGGVQDPPAPKPTQPARKPKTTVPKAPSRPSVSIPVRTAQPAPTSAPAKPQEKKCKQATETSDKPPKEKKFKHGWVSKKRSRKNVEASKTEEVPTVEPQVTDEDAEYQKVLEESMKDAYDLPRGTLPSMVIREPESGKYQPLPKVPRKGKAKVTEELVAHDLLSLQKHKKTSPADQYIFQRRVFEPTGSSRHDESPYALLGQSDSEEESEKVVLGAEEGGQDEGQAGPNPDAQAKDQTGSDVGAQAEDQTRSDAGAQAEDQTGSDACAQAEGQAGSNPDETSEGQAGSNPDETSEGQVGPDPGEAKAKVQSIPNPVVHAGSDREHMDLDVADVSPQPSTKQLDEGFTATAYPKVQENLKLAVEEQRQTFGRRQNAETEVESMVNVTIQQALSSISLMTSPIIDLTSRRESPKEHQQLKVTTTNTTTTTTTTFPPPQVPQQSTTEAMMLFEALEKLINRDHSEELAQDLAEARKKKKKSRESPKTPPGSPSHQPPPPPPAGPSRASGAPGASRSAQVPPSPLPPSSTNQESLSKGSAAPSPSKIGASAEYQAWTTTDIRLRPSISLTPADLEMDDDMAPDEQAQSSDDEDIRSAYILTVNLRQGWWKPFEEERPATPEPAWSIRSSDVPVPMNNWASALASNYSPPPEDSLLVQTGDMATFIDWFCKRRECHKLLTDSVGDPILRNNVSKPLPLGGPPGQVTIQSDFFFNKDLDYLRYGSKGSRPDLSISKMKAAYYPDAGLEQMVPDRFWINEE